jgi:hypothetical protein
LVIFAKNKKMKNSIKDLKHDQRNANVHSPAGMRKLEEGIKKNGLGRSILISNDNEIIAGNGVTETAEKAGITKVRIIETDGNEIIAVKRTDIHSGTKQFYEMALSDNIIAKENIVMDAEVTNAICEEYEIEEYFISQAGSNDFLKMGDHFDDERTTAEKKPSATSDDYSVFELIMINTNKVLLLETLNKIKHEFLFEKHEEALMELIRIYNKK